jgi:hypothetical protein
MQKAFLVLTILGFSVFIISSCSKDSSGGGGNTTLDCNTVTNKAFAADVSPIIQSSCAISGCHASGSTNGPGQLTNYAEIFSARANIRSAVAAGRMPKTGSLSTAQKNSILCWVDSGAPNN